MHLIVTDLDGTLWDEDAEIHPRTRAAVDEVARRGIHLLVATGRRVASTRDPLARHGLAPPAVVLNGALALDLATNARFHRHPFAPDAAAGVLTAILACGLEPCVYVEHPTVDVYVGTSPSTHPDHLLSMGATAQRGDLDVVVRDVPVLAFGIMGGDPDHLSTTAAAIDGPGLGEAHVGRSFGFSGSSLTVAPRGLSKWAGVVAYCELHGLDPGAVLAVGDGPNDVELLTRAAVAIAPDGSDPAVLAIADHVIGSPERGGWGDILEHL